MEDTVLLKIMPAPLLSWYEKNARKLPWREDSDAYKVWVSEIMLQQTRVEAVKSYFTRFLRELPTLEALANAPEDQLLKLWEGLGYYSRVRNLQKGAKQVIQRFGGKMPSSVEDLRSLPGIGDYTAGAIASIAFGIPAPAVDGNVLRVLSRYLCSTRDVGDPKVKKEMEQKLAGVIPGDRAGDFTQALMELGAVVCLPKGAPKCGECPLEKLCKAHCLGVEESLPVKAPKKPRKVEERTVFLLTYHHTLALRRRPEKGLLAGLWELPSVLGTLGKEEAEQALSKWGIGTSSLSSLTGAKHIFSHLEWHMSAWAGEAIKPSEEFVWVSAEELRGKVALPSAFHAFFAEIEGRLK